MKEIKSVWKGLLRKAQAKEDYELLLRKMFGLNLGTKDSGYYDTRYWGTLNGSEGKVEEERSVKRQRTE